MRVFAWPSDVQRAGVWAAACVDAYGSASVSPVLDGANLVNSIMCCNNVFLSRPFFIISSHFFRYFLF